LCSQKEYDKIKIDEVNIIIGLAFFPGDVFIWI